LSSENQKLYDQDIERVYVPLVASPNSMGAEVMRGQQYLPHEADTIIEDV
jgi:hypothetical protein